jgi:YggT family protein
MILSLIITLADAYSLVIFVYVMMSWIPTSGGIVADVYSALGRVCEPYLSLFRRLIPPIGGMVDITPIIALLVLQFGVRLICNLLAVLF